MKFPTSSLVLWVWAGLLSVAGGGCILGLENGQTESNPVVGRSYDIGGYARLAGQHVRIEVLSPADQDPYDPGATWEQLGEDVEVTGPEYNGMYFWETSITIVPTPAHTDRWTDGGLARIRATVVEDQLPLAVFDDTACVLEHLGESALTISSECESPDSPILTLVNTNVVPAPIAVNPDDDRFLTAKANSFDDAETYYETIAGGGGESFGAFKQYNGFDEGDEVVAEYFNDADLGFGREMHCRQVRACESTGGCEGHVGPICDVVVRTACYVVNYGDPGQTPAEILANVGGVGIHSLATVAMEKLHYDPDSIADCSVPVLADPPEEDDVRFYVFNTNLAVSGAAGFGAPLTSVALDEHNGAQAIPGLCLNCHGGDLQVSRSGISVTGARFLPFDVDSFIYSSPAHKASELDDFRQLNAMVLDTELEGASDTTPTPSPIAELVMGWYGGIDAGGTAEVRNAGSTYDGDFVPDGWVGDERLYQEVIGPSCRLCHAAFEETTGAGGYTLPTWHDSASTFAYGTGLAARVCELYDMPHSRRTFDNLWRSGARVALVNELGYAFDCAPPDCSGNGVYDGATQACVCDAGHSGPTCAS